MSENERLIKAFYNLHKEDAKIFDYFKKYSATGGTLGSLAADGDKSFRFAQKLIRSELPMYKALRSILPPDAISAKRYRQFVRNSLSVLPTGSVSPIRRDWTDQAAKSFFATRDNVDPLEYLSGHKDNWVGYDPNNGPLAQRFHELEAVDAQRQFRIRNAGKRKSSLSGIAATDELANLDRINSRLDFLDRLRTFRRATQASGFSRYARAEQESNERIDYERELEAEELHRRRMSDKSFEFEMLDKDEQFIQSAMRDKGWSRDQAEQVYFRNLTENTKWLRFIAKDNPKIAKNLIPIAKAVGKASGLPFIGGLFANPTTAIMALGVGAIARTVSGADEANATIKKWKAYEGLYGNPTDKQKRMARLAGIKDVANISKVYGRLNVQRGDAESYLMNIGMSFRAMDERSAQLLAESEGLSPEEVRLAKLYAGESASKADVVDANIEYLKEIQQRGFETGSGARATMRSLSLSIPYAKSAVARGMVEGDERFNEQLEKIKAKEWSKNRAWSVASNYRYDDPEKYQAMADAIKNTWDEVHDTAEIDDRYRAGMYDNSTTNNNGGDRSVTVIQNINAEVKDSDPVGFVKEMTLLGGRGKHEAESVLQNNDSLRTN